MAIEAPPGNGVATTLASSLASGATTCSLTNASAFTNAQYHCLITDGTNFEIVEATGLSGSTLTIVRGAELYAGSNASPASFAAGSAVTVVPSQQSVNNLIQQVTPTVFNVKGYGALGNGITNSIGDGHGTVSTFGFTSASGAFTTADIGKSIGILGAGPAGVGLLTTIAAVGSATSITLSGQIQSTVTTAGYFYGNDDTAAINAAISACISAGGGIVFVPPGVYPINNSGISFANVQTNVIFMGSGETATMIKALAQPPTTLCLFQCNGWIQDITLDANFSSTASALEMSNAAAQTSFTLKQGAFRVTAQNSDGSWVMVCWDRNQTYQIDTVWLTNVTVKGPGNSGGDNFAISYANNAFVNNISFINLQRSPNFYVIKNFVADGIYSNGAISYSALVFDAGILDGTATNVIIDPTQVGVNNCNININSTKFHLSNVIAGTGGANVVGNLILNALGTSGVGIYRMDNCDFYGNIQIGQPIQEVSFNGGSLTATGGDSIIVDASAASSTTPLVRISNSTLNGINGVQTLFRASHAVTYTIAQVTNCKILNVAAGAFTNITLGATSRISGNAGYNPVGSGHPGAAFALPLTTATWTNATGVDGTLYCTTPTGCTAVSINGVALGAPIADAAYRIVAGGTFIPTYTGTPVFVFVGD